MHGGRAHQRHAVRQAGADGEVLEHRPDPLVLQQESHGLQVGARGERVERAVAPGRGEVHGVVRPGGRVQVGDDGLLPRLDVRHEPPQAAGIVAGHQADDHLDLVASEGVQGDAAALRAVEAAHVGLVHQAVAVVVDPVPRHLHARQHLLEAAHLAGHGVTGLPAGAAAPHALGPGGTGVAGGQPQPLVRVAVAVVVPAVTDLGGSGVGRHVPVVAVGEARLGGAAGRRHAVPVPVERAARAPAAGTHVRLGAGIPVVAAGAVAERARHAAPGRRVADPGHAAGVQVGAVHGPAVHGAQGDLHPPGAGSDAQHAVERAGLELRSAFGERAGGDGVAPHAGGVEGRGPGAVGRQRREHGLVRALRRALLGRLQGHHHGLDGLGGPGRRHLDPGEVQPGSAARDEDQEAGNGQHPSTRPCPPSPRRPRP